MENIQIFQKTKSPKGFKLKNDYSAVNLVPGKYGLLHVVKRGYKKKKKVCGPFLVPAHSFRNTPSKLL